MAYIHPSDHQVYDVEHGYAPEFISGNYYNYHELKRKPRKRHPHGKVQTFTIEGVERAKATKDERRAARQASRQAAKQALLGELALGYAHKPKSSQPTVSAARLTFDKVTGNNPYNLASIHC